MKWRIVLLIFVLLIGLVFYFQDSFSVDQASNDHQSSVSQMMQKIKTQLNPTSEKTLQGREAQGHSQVDLKTPFQDWLQLEAQKMELNSFDPLAEEVRLKQRARTLTRDEIQSLKKTILDLNSTANERVFSTYLLTLTTAQGLQSLQDVAASDLSVKGTPQPHSLDETQSMHEKAVRRMAIDDLFKRAIQDPNSRPELARFIERISNPELKKYAQNRFEELFGHK